MKKIIILLIIVTSFSFSSEACKCDRHDNSFMYLLESDYVFLGTVMSIDECGDNNKTGHEFWIEDGFKGNLPIRKTIFTDCITSCSFQLKEGERYLVFSDLLNDNINFCDFVVPFADSSFLLIKKYLDEITYERLNYLDLYETEDESGYKARVMVQNGQVRGVVNIFDEAGNIVLKGLMGNGQMQGYYEIKHFGITENEIWTGNYKNGKRIGDWIYKATVNDDAKTEKRFILYKYEAGEIVKVSDLSMEAQLEEYEPEIKLEKEPKKEKG